MKNFIKTLCIFMCILLFVCIFNDKKINTLAKVDNQREIKQETQVESKYTKEKQVNIIETEEVITGYIFIGDSRFVGMNNNCNIDSIENNYVIASVGQGYNFLVEEALPKAELIKQENKSVNNWVYIINLGVNDLHNCNKYIETYTELAKENSIIFVTVNPLEYHDSIYNNDIEKFNSSMKDISGINIINTYTELVNNGYSTVDGIHYNSETYKYIFEIINNNI